MYLFVKLLICLVVELINIFVVMKELDMFVLFVIYCKDI